MNQARKSKKKSQAGKAKTPEAKFQQTLEKLQRFLAKNKKLEANLIALKERVTPIIQADINALTNANLELAIKLASFFDKKSLPEYYREELFGWIIDLKEEIIANPLTTNTNLETLDNMMTEAIQNLHQHQDEKLRKKLQKQGFSEKQINETLTQHNEQEPTPEEIEAFFEEIFNEAADEEPTIGTHQQDDLFGFESNQNDSSNNEGKPFENFFDEEFDNPFKENARLKKEIADLINGKAIKTLFRRIAKALHPDMAQTPEEKEEKHHKMVELLKARDEKNLPSIFKHYLETVGNIPTDIFSGDINQITNIIERQIDDLKDTQFVIAKDNPELLFYYGIFYSPTASKQNKNIEDYKKHISEKKESLLGLTQEIKNLSILKECLDERYRLKRGYEYEFWE